LRVLFVSGSLGLGHVTRDLAIAAELRRREPSLEILWFAGPPASGYLRAAGERLVEEAAGHADDTAHVERIAGEFGANIARYTLSATMAWARDAVLTLRAARRHRCDLVLGDEAYEAAILFSLLPRRLRPPFVNMYDFVGLDAASDRLTERALVALYNLVWAFCNRRLSAGEVRRSLFLGVPEDVPERALGPFLPGRRREAERFYTFVGYALPFDAEQWRDRARLRTELGYGPEPLVVASVGGAAVGGALLELCGQAFPLMRRRLPALRMVLVCGPRIEPASLRVPEAVDRHAFVPDLYKHFAVSDLAIVQAGGTTTLELTALRRPFIYFPLEGHCEQEIDVAARLARHGAGFKMRYSATDPALLADAALQRMTTTPSYPPPAMDGAAAAAEAVLAVLHRASG
jgi:UDP-N-acetylglucosamine:LPS N-acetylglucosamine transferase